MLSLSIIEFLSEFRPKTHAVMFYYSADTKREILFNHLMCGAKQNQGLVYVCSEETPRQIRDEMRDLA